MRPPFVIQTIDRFFWTGAFWDVNPYHAKQFPDRCSAITDLERHGQAETPWLIRPAMLYAEKHM